jgi:hypothetical protein
MLPKLGFRIGRTGAQAAAVGNFEAVELGELSRHKDLHGVEKGS